jgi:hypothetical protein
MRLPQGQVEAADHAVTREVAAREDRRLLLISRLPDGQVQAVHRPVTVAVGEKANLDRYR